MKILAAWNDIGQTFEYIAKGVEQMLTDEWIDMTFTD